MLLQKIKEQYKKTIIFVSDDSTMLYKYTNNIIIFRNKKIIVDGPTTEVFKRELKLYSLKEQFENWEKEFGESSLPLLIASK